MGAKYFPNLFCRYERKGKGWIKALPDYEIRAFIELGLMYAEHGRLGGQALLKRHGRAYMARIGRIGAIASNSKKLWNRLMLDEMERLGL